MVLYEVYLRLPEERDLTDRCKKRFYAILQGAELSVLFERDILKKASRALRDLRTMDTFLEKGATPPLKTLKLLRAGCVFGAPSEAEGVTT